MFFQEFLDINQNLVIRGSTAESFRRYCNGNDANEFANAIRIYYNYLRPHQALNGLTPSQVAGIPINLSDNRWLKMIELANMSKSNVF
ncbi:MAG: transposase [Candidatus Thermoplasmatota archaeon]|nr:transposase [Candidatus Thermoplasmatota archaeon]